MSLIEMPAKRPDYTGRLLMLNLEKVRRFQCGGFSVGPTRPISMVVAEAQMETLQQAILDGRLIDVTDQNIQGLQTATGAHSPAQELGDTDKVVFIGYDKRGNKYVVTPRDKQHELELRAELESTGTLKLDYESQSPIPTAQISPVTMEELPKIEIIEE